MFLVHVFLFEVLSHIPSKYDGKFVNDSKGFCPSPFSAIVLKNVEKFSSDTVDGINPEPDEVDSLFRHFQGFIHRRWCRISSINSSVPVSA